MKPIFDHIAANLFLGSEIVTMLQASPDSYGALEKEVEKNCNLDEMTEFMAALTESTKVIALGDAEPLKGAKYSAILEEAGAGALAETMAKFEVYCAMQFRKNQQFLNDEFIPYLQELYKTNQAKFDASMGGTNSPEDQVMMMLSARFDWFAGQLKAKLEKKKVAKISELRRNTDISTLLAVLAS
jgi:hypothetical protein